MDHTHAPSVGRAGLLQFIYYFGLGAATPFFTLFFKYELIQPDGEPALYLIGLLSFFQSALVVFSSPAAGVLGDLFRAHRKIISIFSFLSAAGAAITALPGLAGFDDLSLGAAFAVMTAGTVLIGLSNKPIAPLLDTETLLSLHARDGNAERYGSVRFLGSVAWFLASSLFGFVLWLSGRLYLALFGYAAGYFVLGLASWNAGQTRMKKTRLPWEHLVRDRQYRRFLVFAFLAAFSVVGSYQFTGYFMDDEELEVVFIGLALGLGALPEVPIFLNSGRLIRKIGSGGMILTGSAILILKLFAFFLIPDHSGPAMFVAIQLLHGLGWGFLYAGIVRFVDDLAHPELRGTYQNLYQIPWTIAIALSGLFSAWLIERIGSRLMMGAYAAVLAAGTLYFLVFLRAKPGAVTRS